MKALFALKTIAPPHHSPYNFLWSPKMVSEHNEGTHPVIFKEK